MAEVNEGKWRQGEAALAAANGHWVPLEPVCCLRQLASACLMAEPVSIKHKATEKLKMAYFGVYSRITTVNNSIDRKTNG